MRSLAVNSRRDDLTPSRTVAMSSFKFVTLRLAKISPLTWNPLWAIIRTSSSG